MFRSRKIVTANLPTSHRNGFLFLGPVREISLVGLVAGVILSVIFNVNEAIRQDGLSDEQKGMKGSSNPVIGIEYDSDRNIVLVQSWNEVFEEVSLADGTATIKDAPGDFFEFESSEKNSAVILMSQWAEGNRLNQGVTITRHDKPLLFEQFAFKNLQTADVCMSKDGSVALIAGHNGTIVGWDLTTEDLSRWEYRLDQQATATSLSPDGKQLFVVSKVGTASIRDTRTGTLLASLPDITGCSRHVTWSAEGRQVAAANTEGMIYVFDSQTGEELWHTKNEVLFARVLKFSADGQSLAISGFDRTIWVWNWRRQDESPRVLLGCTSQIGDLTFTDSGKNLVAGCTDGTIREWSIKTTQMTRQFR